MHTCLLVSGSPRGAEKLEAFLASEMPLETIVADSGGGARRSSANRAIDFCIINAPLPDEFGFELAVDMVSSGPTQVLLIVAADFAAEYALKAERQGVLVISKPLQPPVLRAAFHWMKAGLFRIAQLAQKNQEMQQRLETIRLVDRAKCILVETDRMTEAQAHKHIERRAMDMRISKAEVARRILQVYDA